MKALVVSKDSEYKCNLIEKDRPSIDEGEVLIQSLYSSINYKDALAVTGKGRILKKFPLVPGIDVCGLVVDSRSNFFKKEDLVFQTGQDLGEIYDGGFSQFVKLSDQKILKVPKGITPLQIMTLGTAGFTAGLAVVKMELNGLSKEKPILVSGASGGVGSFAVQILAEKGYVVEAVSGKPEAVEWLKLLGAKNVVPPSDIIKKAKPLEAARWSGCVDNIGDEFLSSVLPQVDLHGSVASIGLAGGHRLNSTVMPFILRGVNLLGISSNNCPWNLRSQVWQGLAEIAKSIDFDSKTTIISMDRVPEFSQKILDRKIIGRVVIQY